MLSSTATTTIDRDETEELGKALGLDFALTFLFLPRPFASASKPAEEDPPEKVLLDAKKTGSDLIKKEFDDEGKLSDGMSGMRLSYFGARYYDAEIGQWGSTDPAGQYWSGYSYCQSNPVMVVDPDGNFSWAAPVVSAIIGAGIGTAKAIIEGHAKDQNFGEIVGGVFLKSNAYGAIGFGSGAAGGEVGGLVGNAIGGGAGLASSVISGAASGAVGAATSYTGNYAADAAFGGQSFESEEFFSGLGKQTLIGAASGAAVGFLEGIWPGDEAVLYTKKHDLIGHSAIWGEYNGEPYSISVGPNGGWAKSDGLGSVHGDPNWPRYEGKAWSLRLTHLSGKRLAAISDQIENSYYSNTLLWSPLGRSCVNYTSTSLFTSGAPSALISFHPMLFHIRMAMREAFWTMLPALPGALSGQTSVDGLR